MLTTSLFSAFDKASGGTKQKKNKLLNVDF